MAAECLLTRTVSGVSSELVLTLIEIMSQREDKGAPDAPLIVGMVPVDSFYEKVGQATVDANEDLLTRLVSAHDGVFAKSKVHPVLAQYRELRGFPPNPQWVRDESWKIVKTWRYVENSAARASGSNYDSMRRLKKIIQSRQGTAESGMAVSCSAESGSVLADPYQPGELDDISEQDDADDEDMCDENSEDSPASPDGPGASPAAPAASTRSLARHISTVSVASSEQKADDPAAGPTLVDLPSSPAEAVVYDCAEHRAKIKAMARQRRFKHGKQSVKKKPASSPTTPKAKTSFKMVKRGAAGPKLPDCSAPDCSAPGSPEAELELQRLLKLFEEEPEGQPCDITDTKRFNRMNAEGVMQIKQVKTGEMVQLTSRGFHLDIFNCAVDVLAKALLRGYTKPQLERMKKLILKHMRDS